MLSALVSNSSFGSQGLVRVHIWGFQHQPDLTASLPNLVRLTPSTPPSRPILQASYRPERSNKMHGVKREKQSNSADARATRKAKEAAKLQAYLEVERGFFEMKRSNELSVQALNHTTHLLGLNPEFYTCWNHRRKILLHLFENPPKSSKKTDFFASAKIGCSEPTSSTQSASANPGGISSTSDSRGGQSSSNSDSLSQTETEEPISKERKARYKFELLSDDLEITMHALRAHPKVYWIWNHRKWCLGELPEVDTVAGEEGMKWKSEMKVVEKMLELDPRNFHGWDYRRYLLSRIASPSGIASPSPPSSDEPASIFPSSLSRSSPSAEHISLAEKELNYTMKKIQANFSNFSAWHQRSKILPRLWDARGWDLGKRKEARAEELDLVKQAMFTDPSDQSVWLYHRWLVEQDPQPEVLQPEIEAIKELLEEEKDSKWCMQSLSHYLIMLSKCDSQDNAEDLRNEATALLKRLVEVDSDRKERYRDTLKSLTGL